MLSHKGNKDEDTKAPKKSKNIHFFSALPEFHHDHDVEHSLMLIPTQTKFSKTKMSESLPNDITTPSLFSMVSSQSVSQLSQSLSSPPITDIEKVNEPGFPTAVGVIVINEPQIEDNDANKIILPGMPALNTLNVIGKLNDILHSYSLFTHERNL